MVMQQIVNLWIAGSTPALGAYGKTRIVLPFLCIIVYQPIIQEICYEKEICH